MATAKSLQKPTIQNIIGSTITIKHPDITQYTRSEVISPFSSGGTTLYITDNNGFADDDWFILGEIGDAKTEECDVNGAVTRGTSITITNTTKFSHELHTPVNRILERQVKIYGAATSGGAGTLVTTISIQWNRPSTSYTLVTTDTAYAYYYATFHDGTTASSASDYVASTGLSNSSALEIAKAGMREVNASVDGEMITWEWLLDVINDWQDEVINYVDAGGISKDWTFEETEDLTSIAVTLNENKYALSGLSYTLKYPNSTQGIIQVKLGSDILFPIDVNEFEHKMDGKIRTQVTTGASAGDTTLVVDDVSELSDSGTIYAGAETVTYTGITTATNTLTGIPASGTGSITATLVAGAVVWQGVSPEVPDEYTVYDGYIYLTKPIPSDAVGRKIKVRGISRLARLDSLSDATSISFPFLGRYYVGSRIESKKGNLDNATRLMTMFRDLLSKQTQKDTTQLAEQVTYYNFSI
jgi:hypothetical protein